VLKAMGVKRGDRSRSTWAASLELPIAMLACAKIGAMHSVVYGGFSVEALARPHRGRAQQGRHHLRWRLDQRQDRRAEGDRWTRP
jgi:hypothetical protein